MILQNKMLASTQADFDYLAFESKKLKEQKELSDCTEQSVDDLLNFLPEKSISHRKK